MSFQGLIYRRHVFHLNCDAFVKDSGEKRGSSNQITYIPHLAVVDAADGVCTAAPLADRTI